MVFAVVEGDLPCRSFSNCLADLINPWLDKYVEMASSKGAGNEVSD